MTSLYYYRCECVRVIDGDTVDLLIDLGLHVHIRRVARLRGINAPEVRGATREAGELTKRRLAELIDQAEDAMCCRTFLDRTDKYGRLLVELFPYSGSELSFNQQLVNEELAVAYA